MLAKTASLKQMCRISRIVIIVGTCLFLLTSCLYLLKKNQYVARKVPITFQDLLYHKDIVNQYYEGRKSWKLSKLGETMYLNKEYPEISHERRNKTFIIWKARLKSGPYLSECSVNNCIFTGDKNKLQLADGVIIHLQRDRIPSVKRRNPTQRWMFLNDEAPPHVFSIPKRNIKFSEMHNIFNWSLTYRSDANVPVPYGRTVALKMPRMSFSDPSSTANFVPNWKDKKRDVLIGILISNCGVPYRRSLIKNLKELIQVNVHGNCGDSELKESCPGHFRVDCEVMSQYLFYLALENSKCKEYMTEKLFYNAYLKGAIPIIQGPTLEECEQFLPPNSYLHIDNYASLQDLAEDVERISKSDAELLYYHKWRNHFEVVNEHGYFGVKSLRLCRVCEAMNYNDDRESVFSEQKLREYLDPSILCRP